MLHNAVHVDLQFFGGRSPFGGGMGSMGGMGPMGGGHDDFGSGFSNLFGPAGMGGMGGGGPMGGRLADTMHQL